MFFYEGQACPVCGQRFSEHDDIVTCPQCGCPHHRSCWQEEGHCHFSADHGTERQWAQTADSHPSQNSQKSTIPQKACPYCGHANPEFAEFCAHCGRELEHGEWESQKAASSAPPPPVGQYTPPFSGGFRQPFQVPIQDPYGGVPRTEEIDGIPVDQIAELVGNNSSYYLPRFYKMTHGGSKISWNWSAFLLSSNWLLYRKNLLWGIVAFVLETIFQVFNNISLDTLTVVDEANNTILYLPIDTILASSPAKLMLIILFVASFALLALRIFMGMFGNYIYLQTILKKAKNQQQNPQLKYDRSFLKTGGTSFALAIAPDLLYLAVEYILLMVSILI